MQLTGFFFKYTGKKVISALEKKNIIIKKFGFDSMIFIIVSNCMLLPI